MLRQSCRCPTDLTSFCLILMFAGETTLLAPQVFALQVTFLSSMRKGSDVLPRLKSSSSLKKGRESKRSCLGFCSNLPAPAVPALAFCSLRPILFTLHSFRVFSSSCNSSAIGPQLPTWDWNKAAVPKGSSPTWGEEATHEKQERTVHKSQ